MNYKIRQNFTNITYYIILECVMHNYIMFITMLSAQMTFNLIFYN